jgi:hypothetical protein
MGSFALLTVRGRKSGKLIETPIAIFVQGEKSYLIATYGIVNWVRNLRMAGGEATITRSRRTEKIHAIELLPGAAVLIFREALCSGPPGIPTVIVRVYRSLFVLPYLNVNVDSSLEEFEREVLTHPVFFMRWAAGYPYDSSRGKAAQTGTSHTEKMDANQKSRNMQSS